MTSVCKRQRSSSASCGPGRTSVLADDGVELHQSERRARHLSKLSVQCFVLLLVVLASPVLAQAASPSIDYRALTWSEYEEVYASTQTDAVAFSEMYRTGPRVRAKVLVGAKISMNDFQVGEAIFRQRIQEIAGVERIERVQLEYLQTEACSEEEQQPYYVALGISALPPPLGSSGNGYTSAASAFMLTDINAERERIATNLKYGNIVDSVNVTVDSMTLFGTAMALVDMTLEGESFVQLYLKPWVGVQLAIASTVSVTMGINTSATQHYAMERDAFQDLRLRFLLTQRLESLQVRASDIIVRSPTQLLPYETYYADAGVLNVEIHVHDILYADSVETYLLGAEDSTLSSAVANAFNVMEPDWRLIAMDVDKEAGELFVLPSGASTWVDTGNSGDSETSIELTFELYNVTFAQLERAKWPVLGFIRTTVAQVAPSLVRLGRVTYPSDSFTLSTLNTHNDGDDSAFTSDAVFDPINAINWTLSFKVEPIPSGAFDSVALSDHVIATQSDVESGLLVALGFTAATDRSVAFQSASDWVDSGAEVAGPYVSFKFTIKVAPLDAPDIGTVLESPNVFQLHQVRCALALLLQQVAVLDDNLFLASSSVEDVLDKTSDETGSAWTRVLYVRYRAFISDESQRFGIRSVIFSQQLASTISLYSIGSLELIEREIDVHADGSPVWPHYLPGLLASVPEVDMISDGFDTSSISLLEYQTGVVYRFDDPGSTAASGTLQNAADVCASSTSGLCIKLRFTGADQLAPIFLRKLQSIHATGSSSIGFPPGSSATGSTSTYPAPWVLVGDQIVGGETSWSFFVDGSGTTQSFRLTFEAVSSMQDITASTPFTIDLEFLLDDPAAAPIVRRRQFGDLAVMDTTGQPVPVFIAAELPDLIDDGDEVTGITITLDLEQPRLGGLYSGSLLNEVASTCSECTTLLDDCNSSPECRAFSACMGLLLEADLTLIATMLEKDDIDTSVDATWLLRSCLSPSDGTEWSSAVQELLESSYACLWAKSCPLAYNTAVGRQIVLDYSAGEQILTFDLASGFASVSFELDTDDGNWAYSFVEDFTANATEVAAQLDTMLTEMYRTALSNVATVKSALVTTEDSNSGVVTAQLTVLYDFLGALPQPSVTVNGGTPAYSTTEEALHLRVTAIT